MWNTILLLISNTDTNIWKFDTKKKNINITYMDEDKVMFLLTFLTDLDMWWMQI